MTSKIDLSKENCKDRIFKTFTTSKINIISILSNRRCNGANSLNRRMSRRREKGEVAVNSEDLDGFCTKLHF